MIKKHLISIVCVVSLQTQEQQPIYSSPDSLKEKSYDYLREQALKNKQQTATAKIYANAWLAKATKECNYSQTTHAYRNIMYLEAKNKLVPYSDSLLMAALKSKENDLIGSAYLTKGIIHYDRKELNKALDYYILANKYLSLTNDQYAIHKVKYSLAHTKYYLGFYEEAIALFGECLNYFKEENDRAYLNTIHSLGMCYTKVKKYDVSSQLNQLGIAAAKEFNNHEMDPYFLHAEGINHYYLANYNKSITQLTNALKGIEPKKDKVNKTVAYFYMGKSFLALNKENQALPYLLKVDSTLTDTKYMSPDLRENYELLIDYYKNKNDKSNQLKYINKLLKADSLLNQNFKYLSGKIFKEYDTFKLIQEKESLEKTMSQQKKTYSYVFLALFLTISTLIYRQIKNKKSYRKKFEAIMQQSNGTKKEENTTTKSKELDINPEIVKSIITNLEKMEQQHKYLQKDLTLIKLAAMLNTNTRYASRVIVHLSGKKPNEYLNDLKIDYLINLLKSDSKYRNYTNKALAEEVGFGSAQNFTRAFTIKTGISPTYFIRELKKERTN